MRSADLKYDIMAIHLRNEGNSFVRKGHMVNALRLYTLALFSAASDREQSLALGNRSHVLFEQRQYGAAIEDIQLALKVHLLLFDCLTL